MDTFTVGEDIGSFDIDDIYVNQTIFPGHNVHVVHPMGLSYSFSLVHSLPFTFYGFVMHAPPLRLQLPTRGEGEREGGPIMIIGVEPKGPLVANCGVITK